MTERPVVCDVQHYSQHEVRLVAEQASDPTVRALARLTWAAKCGRASEPDEIVAAERQLRKVAQ